MTAVELRARMAQSDPPVVLDLREPDELAIARLPEAVHVPPAEFEAVLRILDPDAEYVVVCHHGVRSAAAAKRMLERGFTRVANLLGGLDAWAREVDPTMPRY